VQAQKIEPQIITARQAAQDGKMPWWVVAIGKAAFWLSVALFFKAFADAANILKN